MCFVQAANRTTHKREKKRGPMPKGTHVEAAKDVLVKAFNLGK
jgi:hypothetical protein